MAKVVLSRRLSLGVALALCAPFAAAQSGSPFVGEWAGQVEGVGEAKIVITGVGANGRVAGRMEFTLNSFTSTFGDGATPGPPPSNVGVVAGNVLSIDSALGGRYELTLSGKQLSGSYVRGTTFRGNAEFTKVQKAL